MKFTYVMLLFTILSYTQNEKRAILLDKEDKQPIEFVNIYNSKDFTTSNEDGNFLFTSNLDSIYFYTGGYNKLATTFNNIKDTIYLEKSVFELDEIVVTNKKGFFDTIIDGLENYSFEPYNEKFLLRSVLKYNDSIVRIQDIQGKLNRKTLLYTNDMELSKKDYKVEITNMRKIGVLKDNKDAYFKFPSFNYLLLNFVPFGIAQDSFELEEQTFDNRTKIKWKFTSTYPKELGTAEGNYIINSKNNAIEYFEINKNFKKYNYQSSEQIKYRTDNFRTKIYLSKDELTNKYFINYAKFNTRIEVTDFKKSFTSYYDLEFILTTSENFKEMSVKSNIRESEDIFKLHYRYNKEFWNQENQLLLTNEMTDFIHKIKNDENKLNVKSNF
ncbi:hypothetical protein [Cellulophaga sp. Hel_I_12]|uniref:hypothetical protein n=1 Tax=Cellulophaga sp. Hel_I_12 TaxID=1249972 RepID=UPI0006491FD1|nr:hypothetical protein [Cellulophaga sp. Hel_I_12]